MYVLTKAIEAEYVGRGGGKKLAPRTSVGFALQLKNMISIYNKILPMQINVKTARMSKNEECNFAHFWNACEEIWPHF